ncbi:MAG: Na+/H+ antiporter, partial [Thermomicrobiales bacterium]
FRMSAVFRAEEQTVHNVELVLILLAVITFLAAIAERTSIPYPIFLVVGGLAFGLIPGMPAIELDPDMVFLLFLPPILFSAAYSTSWREFRYSLRPIGLLAIGCVLFTMLAVAMVAHVVIDGLNWPAAFVLGAIVAPPDAVATTAIFSRIGVPRRLVTVLEGESLVNDASALVAYRFAVAAVVGGTFSIWSAGERFVVLAVGGIVLGLIAGRVLSIIIPALGESGVAIMASLIAPSAMYVLAEQIDVSGVLAVVVAGLVLGRSGPTIFGPTGRIKSGAVWAFVVFLTNGLVFILIGLQLRSVWSGLGEWSARELTFATIAVVAAVIIVRVIWVYPATYIPRMIPKIRANDPYPPWQFPAIVSWAGLRGVVSLAAALALPHEVDSGAPFPQRDLIVFLTFAVILVTLVGQGLSIAPLVRWLGIEADGGPDREATIARRAAAQAALDRLDALNGELWVPPDIAQKMRYHHEHTLGHFPESLDAQEVDSDHIANHTRLRLELVHAQRTAIITLRNRGVIGDDALHRIERELDLEELRSEA